MKYVFLFALLVLFACVSSSDNAEMAGTGSVADGDSTSIGPAVAPENPDSVLTSTSQPSATIPVKDTTIELIRVDEEKIKKRAEKSEVAKVACCAEVIAITQCCCDEVLSTFEAYLKKKDTKAAFEMEAANVHYSTCATKIKTFEPAIGVLLDKYLD